MSVCYKCNRGSWGRKVLCEGCADEYTKLFTEAARDNAYKARAVLKMLTESAWPTRDPRWEMVEQWMKELIAAAECGKE